MDRKGTEITVNIRMKGVSVRGSRGRGHDRESRSGVQRRK